MLEKQEKRYKVTMNALRGLTFSVDEPSRSLREDGTIVFITKYFFSLISILLQTDIVVMTGHCIT